MAYLDVVKREIDRILSRPLGWVVSFVIPLSMCLMMCIVFGKGTPTDLPIAVYNADHSELSRVFIRNLNTLQSCKVKYQVTSFKEGRDLLTEGKVYGFIAIPKNFQRDIYRLQQPELMYYYNNQRILIGGIITKDITAMLQSMVVGLDAKIRNKKGMPMEAAIAQANPIAIVDHVNSNPYFNYLYFLALIAFGHILQINMVMISVYIIGTEFKYGTTKEWLGLANNSILTAVLGKWTPYFAIFLLVYAILALVYFGLCGVPFVGNAMVAVLASLVFLVSCFAVGIIFISLNGNFRYCLSNSAFYVAMGFAFAGITFPTMSMPLFAKIYGALLPLSHWIQIMLDQTFRNFPFVYDLKHFVAMILFVAFGFATLIRLKKLALDEKRWYQE